MMADNLLEMAVRQLGSEGIDALSDALGLPEDRGESALNSGLATVFAGMLNKGSSKTGLANLFNMVTGSSGLDLSSIGDVFQDPEQMSSLQKRGGHMLEGIFAGKVDSIGELLSSTLGAGSGGNLLKVAAPIVVSLLGKLVKSKGMDMGGLAALLLGQKPFIKDLLPDGLMNALGVASFDKLGGSLEAHGHAEPQTAHLHKHHKRGGFGRWFWPLLIALAALYALSMCAKKQKVEPPPGEVIPKEELVIVGEKPAETAAAPQAGEGKESGETKDFASSFRDYLHSAARDPNREFPLAIEFAADSATVTSTAVPDVAALVSILQENPGVSIAIEGHTSSEGDDAKNQQLSQDRANAVRQMLLDQGINADRITATGMGSSKPIADNSTEEGRKQNRRISVRVVTFQ